MLVDEVSLLGRLLEAEDVLKRVAFKVVCVVDLLTGEIPRVPKEDELPNRLAVVDSAARVVAQGKQLDAALQRVIEIIGERVPPPKSEKGNSEMLRRALGR